MITRRTLMGHATAGIVAGAMGVSRASAQVVGQPVRIVVGFPAGGGTDILARLLAEKLRGTYASTVIVENMPGGAARIAVEHVKNARPDGSVMLFTPAFPLTVYPHSFRSLTYDPVRDFSPVAPAVTSTLTFSVGPAVPAQIKSLAEFVGWSKANPDKANFATTAAGGLPHFAGVMLSQAAGVAMTAVHYKGGAPALQDLIGGHIASSINPASETLPFAKSGLVRVLAVTNPRRSTFLPDVPTMKESGYDVVVEQWLGVLLPAKTPADIVAKLNLAVKEAFSGADTLKTLASLANEPVYQTPAQFAATIRDDIERWRPVVKASGFQAD